jgi:hypothetical protein
MGNFLENVVRAGAGLGRGAAEALAPERGDEVGLDDEDHELQHRASPAAIPERQPPNLAPGTHVPPRSVGEAGAEPSPAAPARAVPAPSETAPEPSPTSRAPQPPPPARPPVPVATAPEGSIARTPAPAAPSSPRPATPPSQASAPLPATPRLPTPPIAAGDQGPQVRQSPAPTTPARAARDQDLVEPARAPPQRAPRAARDGQPTLSPSADALADAVPTSGKASGGRVAVDAKRADAAVVSEERRSTVVPRTYRRVTAVTSGRATAKRQAGAGSAPANP